MPGDREVTTGVLVMGAGHAGRAAAEAAAAMGAEIILVDKAAVPDAGALRGAVVTDLLVRDGRLAGAVLLQDGAFRVVRAAAGVLATGGVAGLFASSPLTGDGVAACARQGVVLTGLDRVRPSGLDTILGGGVAVRGGATSLPGLFAAGEVAAWDDVPTPEEAAERARREGDAAGREAAKAAAGMAPPEVGDLNLRPSIDDPLPEGFIDVKVDRLREVMTSLWGDPGAALPHVLRLKGEADDFARARPDPALYAFQNACEVAVLLLKAQRDA